MTFTCSRRTLLAGALATAAGVALPGRSNAAWAPDLPPLSDPDWWWGIFRDLTLMGLGSLPGIGGVASYFGALFLPQSLFTRPDEQWQRYVQAINTIVDARIADAIYLQVSARLQGISQALRLYQQAQDAGDAAHLRAVEDAVNVTLTTAMPDFMLAGQEYRLLPLFVPGCCGRRPCGRACRARRRWPMISAGSSAQHWMTTGATTTRQSPSACSRRCVAIRTTRTGSAASRWRRYCSCARSCSSAWATSATAGRGSMRNAIPAPCGHAWTVRCSVRCWGPGTTTPR
jgi:hypothetical protein